MSSVNADAAAAFSFRIRSSSSSGSVARGSSSSAIRVELSGGRVGEDGGFIRPGGSGKGLTQLLITVGNVPGTLMICRASWSTNTSACPSYLKPSTMWPKTACLPSKVIDAVG